jgi:hypothetical protein
LWKDRFRNIFNEPQGLGPAPRPLTDKPGAKSFLGQNRNAQSFTRHSSGAEQFFKSLRTDQTLSVLDMGGASQANISYITDLGHRLSSEDILGTMQQCFGDGDFIENQAMASRGQRFLDQILNFPEQHFDGALVWDTFQFLVPPLLDQVIERLLKIMRPGGIVLAFFSSNERITSMPLYNYRIQDPKTLLLVSRNESRQIQYFNNRTLERMFGSAQAVKFFLSRDHLREVIVRR